MKTYTNLKVATFQERFSQLCEENSGSLTTLAELLHVSKQTVSAWKCGTRSPKQPTIVAIADHFNITIEWLMGFDVERNRKRNDKQIVICDSKLFLKIMDELKSDEYYTVMEIFTNAEHRLRERGEL